MRKIKTLFMRDKDNRRFVIREVEPDCKWVVAGEGSSTRKYDGTCVMFDGDRWWARREVKIGKVPPPGWQSLQADDVTGKTVGWEPAEQSAFAKYLAEATAALDLQEPGTYELIGPKINGNPEGESAHRVVAHALADVLDIPDRSYDGLATFLAAAPAMEGIVWHHPDGRMVKIKRRDFSPS